jgi:AraC-like DNA-binding protein
MSLRRELRMDIGKSIDVELASYSSSFRLLADDVLYFDRTIYRQKKERMIDVFGNFWGFSFARIDRGKIYVCRKGQRLSDDGLMAIFLPPFSIVEWEYTPGSLRFESVMSTVPLPPHLPVEPVAFKPDTEDFPTQAGEIFALISRAFSFTSIGKEERVSPLARRVKKEIDSRWGEDVGIAAIASALKVPHPEMTKSFRDCYGCTPIVYRNRIRVMASLWGILTTKNAVASTAFDVGFNDLSRFNKQFRSHINGTPSEFRGGRRKSPIVP